MISATLKIDISPDYELAVREGDSVAVGQVIAKSLDKQVFERIPIAKILGVANNRISAYLTATLGSQVGKGKTLASKQNLFKKISVLSPFVGKLESIDLKDGSLLLVREGAKGEKVEKSVLEGKVVEVTNNSITINFAGKAVEAVKGRGERVMGNYTLFDKRVDMLDLDSLIEGKIAIGSTFSEGARAKFAALGGLGIIALEYYDDITDCVTLTEESLLSLVKMLKATTPLIILGSRKKIIVPV